VFEARAGAGVVPLGRAAVGVEDLDSDSRDVQRWTVGTAGVNARIEIWFLPDDQVSVSLVTDLEEGPIVSREVLETTVFLALASGVIANLPKKLADPLCEWLREFPVPETQEDIPTTVDGLDLVLPSGEPGQKGVEATFTMKGDLPVSRWKPRGFRLFGRDALDYSQTATKAMFLDLLLGLSPVGKVMLVEAAHSLGLAGTLGVIKMTNHPQVAMTALDAGIEEAELRSS
jgi:hypothetical protein